MARIIVALASGLLLGIGLAVSGMINPEKVLNFLDFAAVADGSWDPSLALVMAAALAVTAGGYAVVLRRRHPLGADAFRLPTSTRIDRRLVIGAILFGSGWGLVGYCPGPAVAGLALGAGKTTLFVVAMIAGMTGYHLLFERLSGRIDKPSTRSS